MLVQSKYFHLCSTVFRRRNSSAAILLFLHCVQSQRLRSSTFTSTLTVHLGSEQSTLTSTDLDLTHLRSLRYVPSTRPIHPSLLDLGMAVDSSLDRNDQFSAYPGKQLVTFEEHSLRVTHSYAIFSRVDISQRLGLYAPLLSSFALDYICTRSRRAI